MLPRINRLRRDFERVYKGKDRVSCEYFLMFFSPNEKIYSRFGFVVKKKVGKAYFRNKLKRRFRFVIREIIGDIKVGYDIIFVLNPNYSNWKGVEYKDIISKFIKTDPRPTDMTFIVQKEVADKYLYEGNLLHNTLKIYANEIKSLGLVQKTKFYPIPKVESKIIYICNLKKINTESYEFENFLKKAYMFPRKTLKNNKNIASFEFYQKRPEELSYTDWQNLFLKNKSISL